MPPPTLPLNVLLVSVSVPMFQMPPPSTPEELPLTVLLVKAAVAFLLAFTIPPPSESARFPFTVLLFSTK